MKSIQGVFTLLTLFSSLAAWSFPDHIIVTEPYLSGPQQLEVFKKDFAQFPLAGEGGFIDVPLRYDDPTSPTLKLYYRLPRPLDSKKPSILYFYGGPGGMSEFSKLEEGIANFNIIYMDQRGTGFSKPNELAQLQNPDYFSSEYIARDAALLVQKLGVGKVTPYGHSYGTIPATIFGSRYPQLTRAVVLEGVIFSGQKDLWSAPHRIKIVQKFFDQLPVELKQKILTMSDSQKVPAGWFAIFAQQAMYENFFQEAFRIELEALLAKPEADAVKEINQRSDRSSLATESLFFASYQLHHISCQELSASEPGSSWSAKFVNGKLQPEATYFTPLCSTIPGMESHYGRTYMSVNYPLNVPVTYFQGTWDGATVAPQAIHHYKNVAKGFAQLILAKRSGHSPFFHCLKDQATHGPIKNCPTPEKLQVMMDKAFLGQPLTKEEVVSAEPSGNWVMTSKKEKP
jgi:proline iminopeptidase